LDDERVPAAVTSVDESVPTSIFSSGLRRASGGIITVVTMIAFEGMAVGPALPTAARELHGLSAFGWAFTAFLGASVVGMVVAGQLSDAHGPRGALTFGMTLFVAGLVIAGTATTMVQLIISRAVQGLGSGLLITAIYVVIGTTYPEPLRPKVFAATSSAWVVPSLLGPAVSGALTQHVSWRWVFLGLVPIALGGCALMVPILRGMPRAPRKRAGAASALTNPRRIVRALVVAAGVSGLESAGQHPSVLTALGAVAAVVVLGWGLHGLLPPGTFTVRPGVAAPIAMRGLISGAFFGAESVIPLMLQQQHGLGATVAGLPLTVSGTTWAVGSWWQGRGDPSARAAKQVRLLRSGFLFLAIAVGLIAVTALPASPPWLAFPAWLFAGLGAGLSMPTTSVLMLNNTTDANRGADSAALQICDTTMAALTTGFAGVLVAAAASGSIGYTSAFVTLAFVMMGVALVGVAVSGRARTVPA
jgi:MFS family permease